MATTSISLSSPTFSHFHKPSHSQFFRTHKPFSPLASPNTTSTNRTIIFHNPHDNLTKRGTPVWQIYATSAAESVPSEAAAAIKLQTAQEIVASSDEGVSVTISFLLFLAFVGLSILTIGVVYLGVTDFLQKRERDKLEKDEETNKKKGAKKKRVRARAGPKGFGQKTSVIDDEDDD